MELRHPFVVTSNVQLGFWAISHITRGRGSLRTELSGDDGETWTSIAELSGKVDPWAQTILGSVDFQAAGIFPGDRCRLRFLVHIQDNWGWTGFPRYGFAIDDISLSGVEITGEGNWRTLADDLTQTSFRSETNPNPPDTACERLWMASGNRIPHPRG